MSSKENVIELEGIEFKCFSLIEYSSLVGLLKLLAKKYKDLEKKMGILDSRMIEKDKRISELEIMLKGVSQSKDDKFPSIVTETQKAPPSEKKEEKEKEKTISNDDFLDDNLDNNKHEEDSNKNKEEEKEESEKQDNISEPKKEESQKDLNKTESNINKSIIDDNKEKEEKEEKEEKKEKEEKEEKEKDEKENDNKEKDDKENVMNNDNIDDDENEEIEVGGKKEEVQTETKSIIKPKAESTKIENKQTESSATKNLNDTLKKMNEQEILENREAISKILKKLKAHDKQLNELAIKTNEHSIMNKNIKKNKNDIEDLNKKFNQLKDSISDINNKLLAFNEEFDKVKVKVQDFNVYDLIQGGAGDGGNLDAAKVLIMNLENKIFKKFGLYDERNKKMDKDFFKMQEDVKNALITVDGIKTTTQRNTDSLNELSENYHNTISNYENIINDIQRKIEQITNKINSGPDFSQIKKEFDKKLKDLEERINNKIDLFLNKEPTEDKSSGPSFKVEDLAMIKDLRRRIGELEKFVSNTFDRINADDMKNRIGALETEMPKKASKYEVNELKEKLKNLDEFVKDLNFKVDSLQQFTEKVRLDLAQIIKKIEFLSGEYSKLAFNKMGKNSDEGKSVVDMSKFIDFNIFNDNKKDVNNKFEKVRLGFEDLSREIEEILSKLSHTPTDKDFSQFQTIIKNLIDDLKINCNKKYADKFDTAKSIKFLETQIKTIHESINKRNEVGDNWLLAKKPINNYVCASCEASIRGELDKRTEYVAWNRYPQREDKAYRLGHGFSRMLQMVNEDIIKNAGEKGYSSDEDKKLNIKNANIEKTYSINASVKLPKVTKRKPGVSSAFLASTEPNVPSSPYDEVDNGDTTINANKPQIVRVIRKSKGGPTQSPSKNSEIITNRSNEYSINEKNIPSNEDLPPVNNNENEK